MNGNLAVPIETFLLSWGLGLGLAYWSGRESGQAKEQRVRRRHVDDAFRRGKAAGFGFLDAISDARTDRMSEVEVVAGSARVFDFEAAPFDWEEAGG